MIEAQEKVAVISFNTCTVFIQGVVGRKGETPRVAPQGEPGEPGGPGEYGFPGNDGLPGEAGRPGPDGFPGQKGVFIVTGSVCTHFCMCLTHCVLTPPPQLCALHSVCTHFCMFMCVLFSFLC